MGIRLRSTVETDGARVCWRVRLRVRVDVHQLVRVGRVLAAAAAATALLAGRG